MKTTIIGIFLVIVSTQWSFTQNTTEQVITDLSAQKWQWMADKNVKELDNLFHEESKFVHMSGAWKKERELEIVESGSIWYKKATVHDTDLEIVENTAVVWNRITLEAHVGETTLPMSLPSQRSM